MCSPVLKGFDVLYRLAWSYAVGENMVTGKQEKLVEWKVLVDTIGIKSADLKDINIFSRVLRLSELPRCRERPQTALCCLEWSERKLLRRIQLKAYYHYTSSKDTVKNSSVSKDYMDSPRGQLASSDFSSKNVSWDQQT